MFRRLCALSAPREKFPNTYRSQIICDNFFGGVATRISTKLVVMGYLAKGGGRFSVEERWWWRRLHIFVVGGGWEGPLEVTPTSFVKNILGNNFARKCLP